MRAAAVTVGRVDADVGRSSRGTAQGGDSRLSLASCTRSDDNPPMHVEANHVQLHNGAASI